MDSFELNKLIGALLAVVFVVFSISIVSSSIFSTHAPEQPGYAIEVAEQETGGNLEAVETGPSIAELMQTADPEAGQSAFRPCQACHTAEEGGANRVGPNLWGIVGRPVASHEGFSYSAAMREFSEDGSTEWDYDHLSEFLKAPRSYIPGTTMAFAGIRNPKQEADLIAYLRTLSNDPLPLPLPVGNAVEEPVDAAEEPAPAQSETQPDMQDDGAAASPETESGEEAPEQAPAAEEVPAEEVPAEDVPADEAPAEEAPDAQ